MSLASADSVKKYKLISESPRKRCR